VFSLEPVDEALHTKRIYGYQKARGYIYITNIYTYKYKDIQRDEGREHMCSFFFKFFLALVPQKPIYTHINIRIYRGTRTHVFSTHI
jgi:hypothetical protein